MPRHKHADVIIAWANGEEVQREGEDGWFWGPSLGATPNFHHGNWRIKPKEEDTWKPCASIRFRFVIRETGLGVATKVLQQMMVNQKAEYKWMDVPVEEEV